MRFLGTGSAVPAEVLTNDMLSTMVDTSDEWIRARTGIRERRIVKDETLFDLALEAARAACEDAMALHRVTNDRIDVVICATTSNKDRCPSIACCLQRDLGLREDILAFDLNAACSGFIYALIVASRFLSEGGCVLVVGCETLSHLVDFTDRSTCILFGDAAGAAVVGSGAGQPSAVPARTPVPSPDDPKDLLGCNQSDGRGDGFFWVAEASGGDELLSITDVIRMDGSGVFKFAVEAVVRSVREVAAKAQVSLDEIDLFILHQANERIIRSAAKRLGVPLERFFMNLEKYGNTSAASIPLALDEALRKGAVKKGSRLIMAGFGGGLTVGAVSLTWT